MNYQVIIDKFCKAVCVLIIPFSLAVGPSTAFAKDVRATPTEVFYLAKSIEDSLKKAENLRTSFTKERLSNNIKTRNVYEKAVSLTELYNIVYPNGIESSKIRAFNDKDPSSTRPEDVYKVLVSIKVALEDKGKFLAYAGPTSPKNPSDVFQQLRHISSTLLSIAELREIDMQTRSTEIVYQTSIQEILPHMYLVAERENLSYGRFHFPQRPLPGVQSKHVYKLQRQFFNNINEYHKRNDPSYEAIKLERIRDLNSLTEDDIHTISLIIAGELKAINGKPVLPTDIENEYGKWRSNKERIAPGDISQLVKHMFMISKKLNSKA